MRKGRKWTEEQRMKFKATMAAKNGAIRKQTGRITTNILDEMWSRLSTDAKQKALLFLIDNT